MCDIRKPVIKVILQIRLFINFSACKLQGETKFEMFRISSVNRPMETAALGKHTPFIYCSWQYVRTSKERKMTIILFYKHAEKFYLKVIAVTVTFIC
jgi:predicted NAD-dependent protein-ADP-ribosyltransferase YbiA (DUF1768 family)